MCRFLFCFLRSISFSYSPMWSRSIVVWKATVIPRDYVRAPEIVQSLDTRLDHALKMKVGTSSISNTVVRARPGRASSLREPARFAFRYFLVTWSFPARFGLWTVRTTSTCPVAFQNTLDRPRRAPVYTHSQTPTRIANRVPVVGRCREHARERRHRNVLRSHLVDLFSHTQRTPETHPESEDSFLARARNPIDPSRRTGANSGAGAVLRSRAPAPSARGSPRGAPP